jgi:hypothetical protein
LGLRRRVYVVTFRKDATARFVGYANDEFIGNFEATYPHSDFDGLVAQLEKQKLFELPADFPKNPNEETIQIEVVTTEGSRFVTTHNLASTPTELRAIHALLDYESLMLEWEKGDE